MTDRLAFLASPWRELGDLRGDVRRHEFEIFEVRNKMAENSDALRELDAQIDELERYVLNDDATDAAEVRSRVARLKSVLTAANGGTSPADPAPEPAPAEPAPAPAPSPAEPALADPGAAPADPGAPAPADGDRPAPA